MIDAFVSRKVKRELKEKYGIEDACPVVSWYLRF